MKHIQHLDELTYTAEGRQLLHKLLSSIRERDQSQNVKITSSRKFDGAPAIVFGRTCLGSFFLSTKAFFNATPIVCYSEADIWKHFEEKPELLQILLHVWEHLKDVKIGLNKCTEIFQADVMFYGASEFGMLSDEYLFQPNLITYGIPMTEAKALGLCVHTRLIEVDPNSTDNNVKYDHIPANFSQNLVNNNVFIVQCDSSVFQSADLKGVAVQDELADKMDILLEDITFSDAYADTLRMFDNALVRGEYVVTDKCGYLANLTKFIAARMVKEIADYKTDITIFRCKRTYLDMIDAPGFIQIHAQRLYEFRKELAGFKQSLMQHLDKYSPTNIQVLNGEHEGYVLYLDDSTVVKIVDRDDFSKKNFQKNGNKFSPK